MQRVSGHSRLIFVVLLGSLILILIKPTLFSVLNRTDGLGLSMDYGIPTRWHAKESDPRSPFVMIPENSIGLDFLTFDSYVRVAGMQTKIYKWVSPVDPLGRSYHYPPLLTLAHMWVLLFTTKAAVGLWSLAVLALIYLNAYFWFEASQKWFRDEKFSMHSKSNMLLAGLFTLSYPSVFSYERGQNDVLILLLISVMAVLLNRRKWFCLGTVISLSVLMKVYPAFIFVPFFFFSLFCILSGLVRRKGMNVGLRLMAGLFFGVLIVVLPLYSQHLYFLTVTLPALTVLTEELPGCLICHSIPIAFGSRGTVLATGLWILVSGCLVHFLYRWTICKELRFRVPSFLAFTWITALMIYFPRTSFDYSLILLIPLFAVISISSEQIRGAAVRLGLLLLLLGFALPRWVHGIFFEANSFSSFLALQVLGLVLVGFCLIRLAVTKRN